MITDNNHLIVKAFATAWKYRELYEQCGNVDIVMEQKHTSSRNVFKYLSLAYMNPQKINDIMSGKEQVTITNLFDIAAANQF